MFNKRWKRVLVWIVSIVILLGVGGAFAANYAANKLISSMAGDLETEDPGITEPKVTAAPASPTATGNSQAADSAVPTSPAATGNSPAAEPKGTEPANANGDKADSQADKEQPSSSPASNPDSLSEYTAQVTPEKAKKIQENVSVKDKADVVSIVLGELSVSDIKRLQALAQGGLTIDEKKEARSLVMGKVSEQQYNELIQIAKKYGVSEGKTRSDTLAEEKESE